MHYILSACAICFFACFANAETLISNLETPFITINGREIGDIQTIYRDQIPAIGFSTGIKSDYNLNEITVERLNLISKTPSPNLHLELFSSPTLSPGSSVGRLELFGIDPSPTFFPGYSEFEIFHPNTSISLKPQTSYWLAAEDSTYQNNDGLFFVDVPTSEGQPGSMIDGREVAHYDNLDGSLKVDSRSFNYLKFKVDASPVPEGSPAAFFEIGCVSLVLIEYLGRRSRARVG